MQADPDVAARADAEHDAEHDADAAPRPTGDAAVDAALQALLEVMGVAGQEEHPLEARVVAFEAAHRALQDRLADVEG